MRCLLQYLFIENTKTVETSNQTASERRTSFLQHFKNKFNLYVENNCYVYEILIC